MKEKSQWQPLSWSKKANSPSRTGVSAPGQLISFNKKRTEKTISAFAEHKFPLSELAPVILNVQTSEAGVIPLSYENRPFLRQIVDSFTTMKKVYLLFGRQTEKSTTLAALPLLLTTFMRLTVQYTSGTMTQAHEFSRWKIDNLIRSSDILRVLYDLKGTTYTYNQYEKQSVIGSRIKIGSAFADASRIRGVAMDWLEMDELELVMIDVVPILQQAMHHSPYKFELHAATPLSTENTAWIYWDKYSIQHEWAVPCSCRTISIDSKAMTRVHWNILGPKNLSADGPVCELCRKPINTLEGKWIRMTPLEPKRSWYAFRLPQLATPYTNYKEIILNLEQNPQQTLQESFALAVTEARQVFTDSHLMALTDPDLHNNEDYILDRAGVYNYFVGIDWGGGGTSATVVVFGTYIEDVFVYIGGFRYFDPPLAESLTYSSESELEAYIPFVHLLRKVRVVKAGADFGMGYIRNRMLATVLGPTRFVQVHYTNQVSAAMTMKPYDLLINAARDEMLTNFVTALKLSPQKFRFPREQDMKAVHWWQDFKAIKAEVDKNGKVRYIHSEGETDDFFHACFNCLLASHIVYPRTDLFPLAAFQL